MALVVLLGAFLAGLAVALVPIASRGHREPTATLACDDEPAARRPERYAVHRHRILVVDSHALAGRAVARMLDDYVTRTTSGEAALAALARDARYDAILYSLVMPGMSGFAFAAILAERYPALRPRLVFMVNETAVSQALHTLTDVPWVAKPFQYAQLATAVDTAAQRPRDRDEATTRSAASGLTRSAA